MCRLADSENAFKKDVDTHDGEQRQRNHNPSTLQGKVPKAFVRHYFACGGGRGLCQNQVKCCHCLVYERLYALIKNLKESK